MSQFGALKPKFIITVYILAILIFGARAEIYAQKVRLRSQITPECGVNSNSKYADIHADGNIAVQGSFNCRGAFIYDISNPDAPVLSAWYNPGGNQQFIEAIVVGNRGYFGSGNGGGVHIVDLSNPSIRSVGIVILSGNVSIRLRNQSRNLLTKLKRGFQ